MWANTKNMFSQVLFIHNLATFFATFTICMIEHQEDRELMMNEDNDDDESDEVIIPASSKGKKLIIRHRFRGKLSLSILGVKELSNS